ncbi:HEAT repeat domain-containing protein [Streptomyces sp. NBC_01142]|uniref:HEAT repeat domain-containing protein n=1 Tax=Streptomyces sp. NBC_01142 TaxID=2975865 RepID=UPI00225A3534|nr:HEAT repeat domain-containing protein [Streptomyces sp. NBC_01142]MCX4824684.1 HEAT repeat domain-containing protein [Streptomyces sp. NBC_01142]
MTNNAIARVDDLLKGGYVGKKKAAAVAEAVPEAASPAVLDWLRTLAAAGEWARFGRFAGLAAELHPEGLAEVLVPAIESGEAGAVLEDLVDIAGQIGAPEAVPALSRVIDTHREPDAPYFPLCIKAIQSLSEIGTPEAEAVLRTVATGDGPAPLRWHAAEELGIEEELGYDEDEMLS